MPTDQDTAVAELKAGVWAELVARRRDGKAP